MSNTNDELKHNDLEHSYLLTELESNTSRTVSPNTSSLNTQTGLRTRTGKRTMKNQLLKEKETKLRQQENDQQTDFIQYLDLLIEFYQQVERLDAAGRTLSSVF